ncbi:MAG: hypothetical protein K2H34_06905, partial [Lachnospiraceae bacterium]|nr:hypothetical protein [Lachnospiraceae bacterium]
MILTVLKIIGIVVLVILVLLIFILAVVLFTPVRYQFNGDFHSELQADISVKWSPVLLGVTAACQGKKVEYVVRLFGGVIMTNTDARLSFIGRKLSAADDREKKRTGKKASEKKEVDSKAPAVVITDWDEEFREFEDNRADTVTEEADKKHSSPKRKRKKTPLLERIRNKLAQIQKKIHVLIEKLKEINKKKESLLKV